MSNHTPNQVEMNATEDNVIKDIMTVFRLKRKNNAIKRQNNQRQKNVI